LKLNPFNVQNADHSSLFFDSKCLQGSQIPTIKPFSQAWLKPLHGSENGCRGFEQQEEKKAGKTGGVTIERRED
jgi:hypothetical protein